MENAKKLYTPIEFRFGGLYESSTSFKLPTQIATGETPPKIPLINQWPKIMNIGPGLRNLGNTCFFNSVLQCLTYTPPLAGYFLHPKAHTPDKCNKDKSHCWPCLLSKHFNQVFAGTKAKVLSPVDIIKCLRGAWKKFRLGSQEDSHEFLRIFLDNVQKTEKWLINGIYAGKLKNQVQCLECKGVSEKSETFMDLSLEVQKSDSIQRSLEIFFKKENLTGNNKYRCGKCKKLVNAWKGFELEEGPMILTIHLKRFNNNLMKINKFVKFTEKMELKQFTRDSKNPLVYELFALVVHQGSQMWSGHYYSYVKNSNSLWYSMNDETVRLANLDRVLREHAYLLFYVRKDVENVTNINNNVLVNGAVLSANTIAMNGALLIADKIAKAQMLNGDIKKSIDENQNNKNDILIINGVEKTNHSNSVNTTNSTATNEQNHNKPKENSDDYMKRLDKIKESEECRGYLDSIFKKTSNKQQIQQPLINGHNKKENETVETQKDKKPKECREKENIIEKTKESTKKENIMEIEQERENLEVEKKEIDQNFLIERPASLKRSKLKKLKKMTKYSGNFLVKKQKVNNDAIKICVSDQKLAKVKSIDEIFESKIFENDDLELQNSLVEGKRKILEKNPQFFEHKARSKDVYDIEYDKGKLKKKRMKREMKRNDFQKALEIKNHIPRKF